MIMITFNSYRCYIDSKNFLVEDCQIKSDQEEISSVCVIYCGFIASG